MYILENEMERNITSDKPIHLIPPPWGPLSKPNGGGYTLRDVLGWEDATYREIQVRSMIVACRT